MSSLLEAERRRQAGHDTEQTSITFIRHKSVFGEQDERPRDLRPVVAEWPIIIDPASNTDVEVRFNVRFQQGDTFASMLEAFNISLDNAVVKVVVRKSYNSPTTTIPVFLYDTTEVLFTCGLAPFVQELHVSHEPGEFQIFVKSDKTYTIRVRPNYTMEQVRTIISAHLGMIARLWRFTFAGRQLNDNDTLESHGIKSESTLHMYRRMGVV
jgi:hypothetical protein